jgi:hypothetical protein
MNQTHPLMKSPHGYSRRKTMAVQVVEYVTEEKLDEYINEAATVTSSLLTGVL